MPQHEIEMILMRRVATHLTTPVLLVDPRGDLVYFNEAAAGIVGRSFEETATIHRGEWSKTFRPETDDGTPLAREEQPLFVATERREPAHRTAWVRGLDGVRRRIQGMGFPLVGQGERMLGAVGLFWECDRPSTRPGRPSRDGDDPQGDVELILMRQLASYLATPIFLVGPEGSLLFFNEPAEPIFGIRFDEMGEMTLEEWSELLEPSDDDLTPLPPEDRPVVVALLNERPLYRKVVIRGADGVRRRLEGIAFPLAGRGGGKLGAVAIFWEVGSCR